MKASGLESAGDCYRLIAFLRRDRTTRAGSPALQGWNICGNYRGSRYHPRKQTAPAAGRAPCTPGIRGEIPSA